MLLRNPNAPQAHFENARYNSWTNWDIKKMFLEKRTNYLSIFKIRGLRSYFSYTWSRWSLNSSKGTHLFDFPKTSCSLQLEVKPRNFHEKDTQLKVPLDWNIKVYRVFDLKQVINIGNFEYFGITRIYCCLCKTFFAFMWAF